MDPINAKYKGLTVCKFIFYHKHLSKSDVKESIIAIVGPIRIATKVSQKFKERSNVPSILPKRRPTLRKGKIIAIPFLIQKCQKCLIT